MNDIQNSFYKNNIEIYIMEMYANFAYLNMTFQKTCNTKQLS